MSKRVEERALEIFPSTEKEWKSEFGTFHFDDTNIEHREGFIVGYEQAEKDILSKITKEHLEGLKWIEKADITSQPYPYHKYCKDLRMTLEKLLNDE